MLELSGFQRHKLPFTYLSIPIAPRRLSGKECEILVEKMTGRIKSWSSRSLSFARRITLINSVLIAIQAYWSQVMILPRKILKNIEAICRAFLWKGQATFQGAGAVAWDEVCKGKNDGGLGIKKLEDWNRAAMSKYIWAIANRQESLWMRWVHSVYIRKDDWWNYKASIHASWYWRKLVNLKDQIKQKGHLNFQTQRYSIAKGYELFRPSLMKVGWRREVWARLNIPKHSVILWLVMLNRLKTKERLVKFGMQMNELCSLCNRQKENIRHLFFE